MVERTGVRASEEGQGIVWEYQPSLFLVDFINKHVTMTPGLRPCINSDCAKFGYLDIHHYASPEALMKIVQ